MKAFLIFILSFLASATFAQDSISRHAFSTSIYAGIPLRENYKNNDWYKPGFEIAATQAYSVRLKNRFFISLGAGIDYREYRTEPYRRTWSTHNFSPFFGTTNIQHHVDDFDRQTVGKFLRIKVPLLLEYMPLGKFTPYAKAGIVFDAEISSYSTDVYAGTRTQIDHQMQTNTYLSDEDFLLSANVSGGIKFGMNNVEFLLGFSGQIGLTNFEKYRANQVSIVGEFSIRKTIRHTKFPHQVAINVEDKKIGKKNYLYIEGFGTVMLASLNYERSLFQHGKKRIHARVGIAVDEELSGYVVHPPIGLTFIYGRKHGLEVGAEFIHKFGSSTDNYWTTHFGYRIETNKNLLLRFNVTGDWLRQNNSYYTVRPGLAIGYRF